MTQGEKTVGVKLPIGFDTHGLPHAMFVTAANVTDRDGAISMIDYAAPTCHIDGGYTGKHSANKVKELINADVEVVKRIQLNTFAVLPKRWIVERSFGWLEDYRLLWKNCERKIHNTLQAVTSAFISLLLRLRRQEIHGSQRKTAEAFFMTLAHRSHDISDAIWELLKPHLPGQAGMWGGIARDNRLFISAVFWILRTGAPWRDLPPDYGNWNTVQRRFCRWRDKGVWAKLLELLINEPDFEWLMIDTSHIKIHPHGTGTVGGNQEMGRTKGDSTPRYIWPWMRMVCPSEFLSQKVPQRIVNMLLG